MSSPTRAKLIVTQRGQITLPAGVRKRMGIKEGDVLTLEERSGEMVIRPTAVLDVELFSGDEIARWDDVDRLGSAARARILKKARKIRR